MEDVEEPTTVTTNAADTNGTSSSSSSSSFFIPPSIDAQQLADGNSYTYHSPIPEQVARSLATTECVMGIDEAGRGPVLGPMVYSVLYLPLGQHTPLLSDQYHFNDSKILTGPFRASLLQQLSQAGTPLHAACGWACRVMSARDIGADMQRPPAARPYNLNAQAMDATTDLIAEVLARGVQVREIYIDTIGNPATYQARLQRRFPAVGRIVVEKKADSLYPSVSAASVCAKVTRDVALEVLWKISNNNNNSNKGATNAGPQTETTSTTSVPSSEEAQLLPAWGSGYPSDARCTSWLRSSLDPVFGWAPADCRFSWNTVRDLLDARGVKVEWPAPTDGDGDDDEGGMNCRMTDFYRKKEEEGGEEEEQEEEDGEGAEELRAWFGGPATVTGVAQAAF